MKKPRANAASRKPANRKRRRARTWPTMFMFIALAVIVAAALPTSIIVFVGMVPTLVAFIVDLTPGRYACRCVAGLNVAGIAPFIATLWGGGNDLDMAMMIITDALTWLAFYGSSAFGWMLFLSLPGAVAAVQLINARRRGVALREQQKEIAREWGIGEKTEETGAFGEDGASAPEPAPVR